MRDRLVALAVVVAGVVAIALATAAIVVPIVLWECSAYSETTGYQTKVAGGSCYVRGSDGKWHRWDEWKTRLIGNMERQ